MEEVLRRAKSRKEAVAIEARRNPERAMTFTLGWELEACGRAYNVPRGVHEGSDGSVGGDGREYKIMSEYVTRPVVALSKLRELTRDPHIAVDKSCGFHVHVGLGTKTIKAAAWAGWFVTLARQVEKAAFEAVPTSRRNNSYCTSLAGLDGSIVKRTYHRSKLSNPSRYFWVNVVEMFRPCGIRTVEIRLMGNTRRYSYQLAWISACHLMARHAWALVFDPSMLAAYSRELSEVFSRIAMERANGTGRAGMTRLAFDLSKQARLRDVERPLSRLKYRELVTVRDVLNEKYNRLKGWSGRQFKYLNDSSYNRRVDRIKAEMKKINDQWRGVSAEMEGLQCAV
jgi:hypothetical protein